MDFSSIKYQFKELWDRIQESSLFIELKEKFEVLPSRIQKLIVTATIFLLGLFLFSFPYGNLTDSWTYEGYFEENRELIRDLLRASSTLKEISPLPTMASAGAVESRVRQVISDLNLAPEQVGNIQVIPEAKTQLAPPSVNQEAISLQLKSLNLRQVTDLSYRLQNLGSGIQPISFQINRAQGQTHYFDVIIHLYQFSLKMDGETPPSRPPRGGGR